MIGKEAAAVIAFLRRLAELRGPGPGARSLLESADIVEAMHFLGSDPSRVQEDSPRPPWQGNWRRTPMLP